MKIVHLTSFKISFSMFEIPSFLSSHQNTPLHVAAIREYTDTVEYLVENGAGINIKNDARVRD